MPEINAPQFLAQATELASLVRSLYKLGVVPATSSNFSCRSLDNEDWVIVSQSGKDKEFIQAQDFMIMNREGLVVDPLLAKPSAEALLHTSLYQFADIGSVLHTHSMAALLVADKFSKNDKVTLAGMELLKAFPGIETHEVSVDIPVFANTQDMNELSTQVLDYITTEGRPIAYIISGHGVYTWGDSIAAAKRHLEALEYLFTYQLKRG